MAFEAYLYISGVRGDSTSTIAKQDVPSETAGASPIEIQNYGLGIEMPLVENRSATGAITVGRANFEDFETTKNLEISTSALFFYCLSGKHIPYAVVRIYRSVADDDTSKPTLYMEIKYQSVIITEVTFSGSGDEMPTETLKFNFGSVDYKYYRTDAKTGKSGKGMTTFAWDRGINTGTKS